MKQSYSDIKKANRSNTSVVPPGLSQFIQDFDDHYQFSEAHRQAEKLAKEVELPVLPSQLISMSGLEFTAYIRSACDKLLA